MTTIRVDPFSLQLLLVGVFYFVAGLYLLSIRGKSSATWAMIAYCLALVLQGFATAAGFWTTDIVTFNLEFFLGWLGTVYVASVLFAGVALIQVGYHFLENRFVLESRIVLIVTAIGAIVVTAWSQTIAPQETILIMIPYMISIVAAMWACVVTIRKAIVAREDTRMRRGYIAMAVFLLIVSGASTLQSLWAVAAGYRDVATEAVSLVLVFAGSLAFLIVYIQYAPEPATFHVKLVGYVFAAQLIVFGALLRTMYAPDALREAFAVGPVGTHTFTPDSTGGYLDLVSTAPPPSVEEGSIGSALPLQEDDGRVRVDLPFAFPFGGDSTRSVWVDANGALEPHPEPNPAPSFTATIMSLGSKSVIMPFFTDLSPGLSGGTVAHALSPDSATFTWYRVRPFNLYNAVTFQGVLYPDGTVTFRYHDVPADMVLGAVGILQTPVDDIASSRSVRFVDSRSEYKSFVNTRMMPFVGLMVATLLILLVLSPLFFHASLVAPLRRVLHGVRSVNEGDLDTFVTVGVRDEIGYLSDNFNQMTGSLRKYARRMEDLVAERTKELEESLTALKNTQAQLIQQEKLASLGQMTAGVAHEIKNPLNFINNFAELNTELFEELREALEKGESVDELIADLDANTALIEEHGKRADGIVRSMLQHAHAGDRHLEDHDVNALVEEYVNLAVHSARSRFTDFDIVATTELDPKAGRATLEANELGRVLINLIGNAIDAIREHGGSTIQVSTTGSSDQVEIRVSDDGPGIPLEAQTRIFEPFYTTKPTGSGTGLGLSLSYDIVTAGHGGALLLDSTLGKGTTFTVQLPRRQA